MWVINGTLGNPKLTLKENSLWIKSKVQKSYCWADTLYSVLKLLTVLKRRSSWKGRKQRAITIGQLEAGQEVRVAPFRRWQSWQARMYNPCLTAITQILSGEDWEWKHLSKNSLLPPLLIEKETTQTCLIQCCTLYLSWCCVWYPSWSCACNAHNAQAYQSGETTREIQWLCPLSLNNCRRDSVRTLITGLWLVHQMKVFSKYSTFENIIEILCFYLTVLWGVLVEMPKTNQISTLLQMRMF